MTRTGVTIKRQVWLLHLIPYFCVGTLPASRLQLEQNRKSDLTRHIMSRGDDGASQNSHSTPNPTWLTDLPSIQACTQDTLFSLLEPVLCYMLTSNIIAHNIELVLNICDNSINHLARVNYTTLWII